MARRTFGWIQDAGSFNHLKAVISAADPNSEINEQIRTVLIPRFVPERFGRNEMITAITGNNCSNISYNLFKGQGVKNQLTVEENMEMFGYTRADAKQIVKNGGRANAACSGIAQIVLPAQKNIPNGGKKPYQGDWQAECFIRLAVSIGFMDYNADTDTLSVTENGRLFAMSEDGSNSEHNYLESALLTYPPTYRILKLLSERVDQGPLSKFEIGSQLGFQGEAGFTSFPENLYVEGICQAASKEEKKKIHDNFEGSSDKYARMIAHWLCNVGWVEECPKKVSADFHGTHTTVEIGHSYKITANGRQAITRIEGGSRNRQPGKRVLWYMLATAAHDAVYLRNRRYHTLQAIKNRKRTLEEISEYLSKNGYTVDTGTIRDDLKNFTLIGLRIIENDGKYKLQDHIIGLEQPRGAENTNTPDIIAIKNTIRPFLLNVDHRYLDLIDLSYENRKHTQFEIETMALLTNELKYSGTHLGGGSRPDGVFYNDVNGVIVDTKAYSDGFSLLQSQADEMIRYIDENINRRTSSRTSWWENFDPGVKSFSYLFVSSKIKGTFKLRMDNIKIRTGYNGGLISSYNLLLLAEKVKSGDIPYLDSFDILRCNDEISIPI